jgi:hypothetical protein
MQDAAARLLFQAKMEKFFSMQPEVGRSRTQRV